MLNITGQPAWSSGLGNYGAINQNTTGAPIAFNPYSQLQRSVMSADPMNQMGNAGYFNQMQAAGGPALPGEPGRDPIRTAPGGRPHLPGEKQTPLPGLPGRLQAMGSSNLDNALTNLVGNITEDQRHQFATENPGSKSQIGGNFFRKRIT